MVQRQNPLRLRHYSTEAYFNDAAEVETLTTRLLAEVAAVRTDDRLTARGRAERRRDLGRDALAAVRAWRDRSVPGLESNIEAERSTMSRARKALTDVERLELALRQSEIRASLRGLDPLEVEVIYRTGDAETRAAIESAPRVVRRERPVAAPVLTPLVRPEVVAELVEARLADENPEAAAKVADLKQLRDLYASLATAAVQAIEEAAPEAKGDAEIRVVAAGRAR